VREFWVKTAAADVKVHEIERTQTLLPIFSWGDSVGDSLDTSASASAANLEAATDSNLNGSIFFPQSTSCTLDITVTASGTATVNRSGFARSNRTNAAQARVNVANSSDTDSANTFISAGSSSGLALPRGRNVAIGIVLESNPAGSTGTVTWNATVTHTIASISAFTRTNPYEAWISASGQVIYVLIKHLQETVDPDDPTRDSFDRLQIIELGFDGTILSSSAYLRDDTIPINALNWRDVLSNFIAIGDQLTTADSCTDLYKGNAFINLLSGNSRSILPSQIINGQTLRQRLQTSPDTIAATLSTRPATSGASCTLGTAAESTVQVASPGRGTVEGITYLP
jgi:hypothetical protein